MLSQPKGPVWVGEEGRKAILELDAVPSQDLCKPDWLGTRQSGVR